MTVATPLKLGIVVDTDTRASKQEFSQLRTEVKKQADLLGGDWERAAEKVEDALKEAGARTDLIDAAKEIGKRGPTEIEKMRDSLRDVGTAGHDAATDIQDSLDSIDVKLADDKFDNFKSELRANAVESGAELVRGFADGIDEEDKKGAIDAAVDILFQTGATMPGAAGAALMGGGLALSLVSGFVTSMGIEKQKALEAINELFNDMLESGQAFASEALIQTHIQEIAGSAELLAEAERKSAEAGVSRGLVMRAMAGDVTAAAEVQEGYNKKLAQNAIEHANLKTQLAKYGDDPYMVQKTEQAIDANERERIALEDSRDAYGIYAETQAEATRQIGAYNEATTTQTDQTRANQAVIDANRDAVKAAGDAYDTAREQAAKTWQTPVIKPEVDMSAVDRAIKNYKPPTGVVVTANYRMGQAIF